MFYSNLKRICDEKGIKITPLVLECGGTKGIIGGWKKGISPNSDIVMKIAVKLNITTDELLFGKDSALSYACIRKRIICILLASFLYFACKITTVNRESLQK